jgi:hypothetical protein
MICNNINKNSIETALAGVLKKEVERHNIFYSFYLRATEFTCSFIQTLIVN